MTRRFDGVVFDLFGTLVPEFTRSAFFGSIAEMARTLGAPEDTFLAGWELTVVERQTGGFHTVEDNVRHICRTLGLDPDDGRIWEALAARDRLYSSSFRPRTGALETLREVRSRGYPLGLVSVCAPDTPAMWRASAFAGLVDVEVFSSEVGLRKPDPAIYLWATERMGVDPSGCLYCGDGAYRELSGAQAVGMTSYLIVDGNLDPAIALTPDREEWSGPRIEDLRDLLELLPGRT